MRIPMLKTMYNNKKVTANTNEDKSQMLVRVFFPTKPLEEMPDA
jgi:hypothetical protein